MVREEITDKALEFLNILKASGDWMSRSEIARKAGQPKGRASSHTIALLERLEAAGLIESRIVKVPGAIGQAYEYRAK